MRKLTKSLLVASVLTAMASVAQAYTAGDIILNFRTWDGTAAGANDLTIDIGQFSSLYNGETVATGVFSTLGNGSADNVQFSALGYVSSTAGLSAKSQFYVSKTRVDGTSDYTVAGSETPWVNPAKGGSSSSPALQIKAIGDGNPSGVPVVDATSGASTSYHAYVGTGNLQNKFAGNVETSTGTGFVAAGTSVAADLFYLDGVNYSAGAAGTYSGVFILNTDGSVVYNPVPEPATFGVLAAAGLLAVATRRQMRKQA